MSSGRGDLSFAAMVFLEGSEPPSGGRRAPVDIGHGTLVRVTDALGLCDAVAVSAIAEAVERYRQDGSWHSREAIIEAVTLAVVPGVGS